MKASFKNNSGFKTIKLTIGNIERTVKRDETVWIDIEKDFHLNVYVPNENRVMLNWLDIILFDYLDDEGVLNLLSCNAEYCLEAIDKNEPVEVTFCELLGRDTNQCIYESVYLKSNNVVVNKSNYHLCNTGSLVHKSRFYQLFVVSWIVPLIIVFFSDVISENVVALVVNCGFIFFILFACTIPALKKYGNIKRFFSASNADSVLKKQEIIYQRNNDAPVIEEPKGIMEKMLNKVLNFMFGKKS